MSSDRKNLKVVEPGLLEFGQVLQGRYVIQRPLGVGSAGQVYLALDRDANEHPVALKVLHIEYAKKQSLQSLIREVEIMRQVEHQNVVKTLGMGADADLIFYVSEFIPGWSLGDLSKRETFTSERIAEFALDVLAGLEAIHNSGLCHRDLKPSNVIVTADGRAKLSDYALGKMDDGDRTTHSGMLSSAGYMAPEIWKGEKPAPGDDLYSLGIILYQLTTGRLPFSSGTAAGWMRHHLETEPIPPRELNSATPKWLNKLILSLLIKDSNKRPKSARELITRVKSNTLKKPEVTSEKHNRGGDVLPGFGWKTVVGASALSSSLVALAVFSFSSSSDSISAESNSELGDSAALASQEASSAETAPVRPSKDFNSSEDTTSSVELEGEVARLNLELAEKSQKLQALEERLNELATSKVAPVPESEIAASGTTGQLGIANKIRILTEVIKDSPEAEASRASLRSLKDPQLNSLLEAFEKRIADSDRRASETQKAYSSLLGESR